MAVRSEQIDEKDSQLSQRQGFNTGGSSGMDMLSGFTNLGDKLQNNALRTIQYFQGRNDDLNKYNRDFNESARRFKIGQENTQRDQNLNSLNFLGKERERLGQNANMISFKNALSRG